LYLNNRIITGIAFIILGGLSYLGGSIFDLDVYNVVGITFVVYGVLAFYVSLGSGKRGWLFLSTIIFFIGIILIVKSSYELIDTRGLAFASILFIGGAVFLILFLENNKIKVFAVAAILLMLFGYLSTNLFKQIGILNTANSIAIVVEDFWPAILIFLGLNIFLTRKK
jgi:hypothetical protein